MSETKVKPTRFENLNIADIIVGKGNPRKEFDQESIKELAQSIAEKGVLQPILVRPTGKAGKGPGNLQYELVCGERRLRASILAQTKTIPATIRELSDEEALQAQIVENLQRKDIHPMEEAVAFLRLSKTQKWDASEISRRVGKSPFYVATRIKLNDLIAEYQKALFENRLTMGGARELLKLSAKDQGALYKEENHAHGTVKISKWNIREFLGDLMSAPFDTTDPDLKKDMGACSTCQFNTASNTLLFPEAITSAQCSKIECFKSKCTLGYAKGLQLAIDDSAMVLITKDYSDGKQTKALKAKGQKVLTPYEYDVLNKPDPSDRPDLNDLNNYDPSDFDNEKERKKQFESDLQDYNEEILTYEKKKQSGKYTAAFIVEGNDQGSHVLVSIKKQKGASKKEVAEKTKDGKVTKKDLQDQISAIKDRFKRSIEIDHERLNQPYSEILISNKAYSAKTEKLSSKEMVAFIICLLNQGGYEFQNKVKTLTGCRDDYHWKKMHKHLRALKDSDLFALGIQCTRAFLQQHLPVVNPQQGWSPDEKGQCAALASLAFELDPKKHKEVNLAVQDEYQKRKVRFDERVADLNKKINQLKK